MPKVLFFGLIVSFGIFAGRISGFLREVFIASIYGASASSDLVIVLLTIPDVLVNLLVGGALGMALVPEFKSFTELKAKLFYLQILYGMFALFVFVALLLTFFSSGLLKIFSPGLSPELLGDAKFFLRISLFAIPFTVVAGVTTAFLHYKDKFVAPAFSTLVFNLILVLVLFFSQYANQEYFLYYLSGGIIFGAIIRWVALLIDEGSTIYKMDVFDQLLVSRAVVARYVYCVLSSGFMFLIPVIVRAASSNNGDGALSITNYALKLVELPLAVVLTVFSIVFIPKFAKLFAEGKDEQFSKLLAVVSITLIFLSLVIFSTMDTFSLQFVSLVYGWGALDSAQVSGISEIFELALVSLTFQGLNSLLISACAARKDTLSPLLLTSFVVLLFSVATYFLTLSLKDLIALMNFCYLFITLGLFLVLSAVHKLRCFFSLYFFKKISLALMVILFHFAFITHNVFSNLSPINTILVCIFGAMVSVLIFIIFNRDFPRVVKNSD